LDKIGSGLGSTANTTAATTDITATGTTDSYTLNYYQCKKQGDAMLMTKSVSPYISNKTAMPGNIKSVQVFINSGAANKTTYDCAFSTTECTSATSGVGAVNITGGNSNVFSNMTGTPPTINVKGKYFCVTLGNANNGQVLKLVITCENTHTITYSATNGSIAGVMSGTSTAVASGASVAEGGKVTLTATPASGYTFTGWSVSGTGSTLLSDSSNPTIFTMGTANSTVTANFGIATAVETPTFSVFEGTYNTAQSVELSCATDDATIYYTTDGSTPTTSSTVYSAPIAVDVTTTIKAFAVADGLDDSGVASATYILKCATPSISIPEGVFVSTKNVTITAGDGAAISYSLDEGENWNSYSEPFAISATTTVWAKATKTGWTDSEVAEETFTKETVLASLSELVAKTNTSDQKYYVNLTNAQVTYVNGKNGFMEDANAGIYIYNITPTKNKVYNGIFQITYQLYKSMPELKAITEVEGTITDGSDIAPVVMTASDLKDNFTANLGRQIKVVNHTTTTTTVLVTGVDFYTTYHNPSFVKDNTYTIVGYPYNNDGTLQYRVISAVAKPAVPVTDFAAGEFSEAFTLHLSCATDGAAIYYTINGDEPTTSSTLYTDGIAIPAATTTVKAIAYLEGMTTAMDPATYTYKAVAKPYFTPVTETEVYYGDKVEVACATEGSAIFYTLTYTEDDSTPAEPADPTSASTTYPDGGIAINYNNVRIKAIAKVGDDYSSIAEAIFTLKNPEAPTFNVEEGDVAQNTIVTISSATGTSIEYSIDDGAHWTDADDNTVEYTITDDVTLTARCYDPQLNISSNATASYTIAQVATPVIDTAAGMLSKGTEVHISTATDGASIYYTLDGSTPTTNSNPYNGYVVINDAHTLKAIAVKENYIDSESASAAYTVAGNNESIVFGDLGLDNDAELTTVEGIDVTLTFTKGTGSQPKYYTSDSTGRIYKNNSLTISSDKTIIKINFGVSSNYSKDSGSSGSITGGVWTGSAKSITINASGTVKFSTITIFYELSGDKATVGDSKFAGFCSEYKVDFSTTDLEAYKAKVDGEGNVILTKITDGIVPANTGVILNGNADDYDIPFTDAAATTDFSDNEMVGVTQRTHVLWNPTSGVYNYILQQGQFNKATNGYLKPCRAYLSTSYDVTALGGSKLSIIFGDEETTGIKAIDNGTIDNNAPMYNISGQRVSESYKGIVIVNGRKVVRK
jgi:uncharacterized repeat protein (TIGR02543 family)